MSPEILDLYGDVPLFHFGYLGETVIFAGTTDSGERVTAWFDRDADEEMRRALLASDTETIRSGGRCRCVLVAKHGNMVARWSDDAKRNISPRRAVRA